MNISKKLEIVGSEINQQQEMAISFFRKIKQTIYQLYTLAISVEDIDLVSLSITLRNQLAMINVET